LLQQAIDQSKLEDLAMISAESIANNNEEYNELLLELSRVTFLDEKQRSNLARAHLASFSHIKKDKRNHKIENLFLKVS
jgi:hypothetical protein